MPVKKRDFILIDYSTKINETGEIFDTTILDEATKSGIFKENTVYEPMLVVVGERWVLKALDDSLIGLKIGKPATVEIFPEDGFGLRDPNKIKLIPIRKFKGQKTSPFPGAQIEIDGKLGTIRAVGAGRVQVDFNLPLAGKTLIYNLTIKKILKKKLDKINALIHRRIPTANIDQIKVKAVKKRVNIELPEEAFYLEGIQFAKRGIAADIQKYLEADKISFIETYLKEKPIQSPSVTSQEQ